MPFLHPDHWLNQINAFFELRIPGFNHVSLLESEWRFEIVTQLADARKRPSSYLYVYDKRMVLITSSRSCPCKVVESVFNHPP
jgi:hypothetical protein